MAPRLIRHALLLLVVLFLALGLGLTPLVMYVLLGTVVFGVMVGRILRGPWAWTVGASPGLAILVVLLWNSTAEERMMVGVVYVLVGCIVALVGARTAVLADAFFHGSAGGDPGPGNGSGSGAAP